MRKLVACLLFSLLAAACSGNTTDLGIEHYAVHAKANPTPAPAPRQFEPVRVQRPALWIRNVSGDPNAVMAKLHGLPGVAIAAPLRLGHTLIAATERSAQIKFAVVDPSAFRPLTPQSVADSVEVWQRLDEGYAAVSPDVARRLKLQLGQQVTAAGIAPLRIGALASNGAIADALINPAKASEMGLHGEQTLLVAIAPKTRAEDVAARIRKATGFPVEQLVAASPKKSKRSNVIEGFTYTELGDGMIEIDPAWVSENIVSGKIPYLGTVRCHRMMIPQLQRAFQELVDQNLTELIDKKQYGGCFVPRHIDFNPAKPISMHAWGLAIDMNVSTNGLGATPTLDPRIVEVFERWGFEWGGRWKRPDGMHFQLSAIVQGLEG